MPVTEGKMESLRNQWAKAAQSARFTKRPQQRTSLEVLQRLLEHRGKDNESLAVIEISAEQRRFQRLQMNRHMLLSECRMDVKPYENKGLLPQSNSKEEISALSHVYDTASVRQQSPAPRSNPRGMSQASRHSSASPHSTASTQHHASDHGVPLQLRDVRVLLSLSEPTLLVRRGVLAMSFGHIRALVTAQRALFILSEDDPTPVHGLRVQMEEEVCVIEIEYFNKYIREREREKKRHICII